MQEDKARWQPKGGVDAASLTGLEAAWRRLAGPNAMPPRTSFDPMDFPEILPWMVLAEIVDQPNEARPYDVLYRYIGSEFARYFDAGKLTRIHLSELEPPFVERWFAVADSVRAARAPCYFTGAPYGTDYDYIALEMLALPFTRAKDELGFVLCAFARCDIA